MPEHNEVPPATLRPYKHGDHTPPFSITAALLKELDTRPADVMTEYANRIARGLAEQKDKLIRDAITRRLGNDQWKIEEIVPRMQAIRYDPDFSTATLFLLDRMPLIVLWPPENDADHQPELDWHWRSSPPTFSNTLSYSFKYKTFEP